MKNFLIGVLIGLLLMMAVKAGYNSYAAKQNMDQIGKVNAILNGFTIPVEDDVVLFKEALESR